MSDSIRSASIVGDGAMGTLCALLLAERGTSVTLWGRNSEHIEALREDRENRRYLPGFSIPEAINLTADDAAIFQDADIIVSAVPCQYLRAIWMRLQPHIGEGLRVVSVTKGIEIDTLKLPTQVIRSCIPNPTLACLTGPCIAPEVAAQKPATVVVAADTQNFAADVQQGMSTPHFRVYTSDDLTGVEIAAAVKNVIALAAGLCDGIGAGDNAKASLMTRGLVEITRLGSALGAREETFRGLAGVGDLFTTCVSKVGRNRSAGERLGRGESVDQVVASTSSVIEGIPTTRSVLELAQKHSVELPIVSAMADVLFAARCPNEAVDELMTRPLRRES